jgi:hypothetical protein
MPAQTTQVSKETYYRGKRDLLLRTFESVPPARPPKCILTYIHTCIQANAVETRTLPQKKAVAAPAAHPRTAFGFLAHLFG